MPSQRPIPRILLLQARDEDDPARPEEVASFADKAGLPLSAFSTHNLLDGPPDLAQVRHHQALMIGGSGEYSVSQHNLPFQDETLALLRAVVAGGYPTFASCFGFHLLTAALGGEVVDDAENMELGTYEITLTEVGKKDELFSTLPLVFHAQLGRKDRAARLPPGAINLAYSARSPFQAFRIPGTPIWATQFHPELTAEENLIRYKRYLKMYAHYLSAEERAKTLELFHGRPDTLQLIPHFLQLIAT